MINNEINKIMNNILIPMLNGDRMIHVSEKFKDVVLDTRFTNVPFVNPDNMRMENAFYFRINGN